MSSSQSPDLDIARQCDIRPVEQIAKKLELDAGDIESYGPYKAKISYEALQRQPDRPNGRLILTTAISPTPAGEGKTTTSIGLADALNRIGKQTIVCLREPSLGPNFGIKGGAAGGGYAQVVPMEEINLHFTGDFHALSAAHNLLAAMVDNHLHHGNALRIDPRRFLWNRVVDLNDRALRKMVLGLGGPTGGIPRESSFDITVASEVMAIFCLSESIFELRERLGRIIIGFTHEESPVTASQLRCHGAMAALLKDALKPNLVQTLEGTPALVHGGPFANIAHGCNSVMATRFALKQAEYTVTEAGFGADLGAEKFFNIKCRQAKLHPDAVVLVATVRALKYHGGVEVADLQRPNVQALEDGFENLAKHLENIRFFDVPVVVAINVFPSDTDEEIQRVIDRCAALGVPAARADHWARGGVGAEQLAHLLVRTIEQEPSLFEPLYPESMAPARKIETVCRRIYGADGVHWEKNVLKKLDRFVELGFGSFPVCMAKTQYSFSADATLRGQPTGFTIPVRNVKISAGAGFIVALTGDIMTMPGLPKSPAAERIDIDSEGRITGLF